jgi:hypothetical protein
MGNIMTTIVITRNQYEKIKEAFEMYDTIDYVKLHFDNSNGIGSIVTLEYNPSFVRVDITDVESW